MNFFEHQDVAQRKTKWLVYAYIFTVVLIVVSVDTVALLVLQATGKSKGRPGEFMELQFPALAGITGVILFIVWLGTYLKSRQLQAGGSAVAEMLGGREIYHGSQDPLERQVWNVVEEMALASGTPVPGVYLLDEELAINAFAAGTTLDDAVIGISRGCATKLSRDELQAVVAHEFSHILQGDMQLNVKLISTLAGITLISHVGYLIIRSMGNSSGRSRSSSNEKGGGGGQIVVIGLAMYVLGAIGAFAAAIIQSAISRQREFFADASGVQFTRNPNGMSGALRAIAGLSRGSKLESPHAGEVRHMFFGQGVKTMFSTHPPLEKRILRIEGESATDLLDPSRESTAGMSAAGGGNAALAGVAGFAGGGGTVGGGLPVAALAGAAAATGSVSLASSVGEPTPAHVEYAHQLIEEMPEAVRKAVAEAYSARAVVLCLLLDEDEQIRARQLSCITGSADRGLRATVDQLLPDFGEVDVRMRVPLLDMAKASLREMTSAQYKDFKKLFQEIVEADDRLSLFEWMVTNSLVKHLDGHFGSVSRKSGSKLKLPACKDELRFVLSALAHAGEAGDQEARRSYDAASRSLGFSIGELVPRKECRVARLSNAVGRLARLKLECMKKVLGACVLGIASDGEVSQLEAELLRVFSETMGCPVPPLLPGQKLGV